MQILNNMLIRQVINLENTVSLRHYAGVSVMPESYAAVYWKNQFQWMNTKNIVDGVEYVFVHTRPFIVFELDAEWFLKWVSLYQEYNEETDAWSSYLYKFSKDEEIIASHNELIQTYAPEHSLALHGRFVQLQWPGVSLGTAESLQHELHIGSYQAILSFLFGVSVAYGQLHEVAGELRHCKINIPLLWSILPLESVFTWIQECLRDHGVYIKLDKYEQNHGHGLQISIDDWEVLFHLVKWWKPVHEFGGMWGKEKNNHLKDDLLAFAQEQGAGKEISEDIEYSVLKIVKK